MFMFRGLKTIAFTAGGVYVGKTFCEEIKKVEDIGNNLTYYNAYGASSSIVGRKFCHELHCCPELLRERIW